MNKIEILHLGLTNLQRSRLRTSLTILGVAVGIGALVTLVSFGTGMQKNVTDIIHRQDLFTSLLVSARSMDPDQAMGSMLSEKIGSHPVLNDSMLNLIRQRPGVEVVFPEIRFSARVVVDSESTQVAIRGLPSVMGRYLPYSELQAGAFFESDSSDVILLSEPILEELGFQLDEKSSETTSVRGEGGKRWVSPDSLIGKKVRVITSVLDPMQAMFNGSMENNLRRPPVRDHVSTLTLAGIVEGQPGFSRQFSGPVIIPLETARRIPRLGFEHVVDLLSRREGDQGYVSAYVRLKGIQYVDPAVKRLEQEGFSVFAAATEFAEMKRAFLVVDTLLGAIGTVALFIAALGITNTMVMSVMERTREIGILKSIGASEAEIQQIFMTEAALIGVVGGCAGLFLGWIVTMIATRVGNHYLMQLGERPADFFYFPFWLIGGAMVFSVVVSLMAGLYPALRASRVDPVLALRHE